MCRYLTAGFLEKDDTIPLLLALEAGGADVSFCLLASATLLASLLHQCLSGRILSLALAVQVIEVGVPFTDPMADGTTIQRANEVALENGVVGPNICIR